MFMFQNSFTEIGGCVIIGRVFYCWFSWHAAIPTYRR